MSNHDNWQKEKMYKEPYGQQNMSGCGHGHPGMMQGQHGMMHGYQGNPSMGHPGHMYPENYPQHMQGQYSDIKKDLDPKQHKKQMFDHCKKRKLHFMCVQMTDGSILEGIIDEYDDDGVTLIIPCGDEMREENEERFSGGHGGYGGYGPYGGYGHGGYHGHRYPRRFRRYRRQRFPFLNIFNWFDPFYY